MPQFLSRYWFLLILAACLAVGFTAHRPLAPLADLPLLRGLLVATAVLLTGLPLRMRAVLRNVGLPRAAALAIGINVVGVPLLAAAVAPLLAPQFSGGLIVAAVVPCTLASAAVWTRRAGGDDATAMMVTLVTNLICFLTVPAWLWLLLGASTQIDFAQQVSQLLLLVVAPLVGSQLLRSWGLRHWADHHSRTMATLSQLCILTMVLIASVASAQRLAEDPAAHSGLMALAGMIVAATAVHTLMLGFGGWLARRIGLPRPQQIAVAIGGSQKTMMIGLQIAIDCGVSMLPMIVYHVGQLIIDTVVADRLRTGGAKAAAPAPAEAAASEGAPPPPNHHPPPGRVGL